MTGYVYLLGSRTFGWYKIGKCSVPQARVKQIGILLPFKVEVIALWRAADHHALERLLHERYAEHKINGEWFRFDKGQLEAMLASVPNRIELSSHPFFTGFANVASDAPEGKRIKFKIKNKDPLSRESRDIAIAAGIAARATRPRCPSCERTIPHQGWKQPRPGKPENISCASQDFRNTVLVEVEGIETSTR